MVRVRNYFLFILFLSIFLFVGMVLRAQDSRNGYWFPPYDTLRIFVIYAELVNDPDDPKWLQGWVPGSLPPDPGFLFDHSLLPGEGPRGVITKYYHQASFGRYVVLGDHYPEMVSIDFSEVRGRGVEQVLKKVADIQEDDIISQHGYSVNKGDFDFIRTSKMGSPKTIEPDSLIDIVMVIWRVNSRMTTNLSAGFCSTGKKMQRMKDMKGMNSYSSFVNKDYKRYTIIRHEFSHLLLGGNNFHTGGAGAGTKTFMSDVGGYAMLSSHLMSSPVYCSWDRRRLGWKNSENEYQISARDPMDNSEIETDLIYSQDFPHGSNEFILRDFVETGDAIRIELPYLQVYSDKISRQWLWLENHQKKDENVDHEKATRKGLYAYIQVGKESSGGPGTFSGQCNYTWPVSAFGNYDFLIDEETRESETSYRLSNPFTGYNNLVYGVYDLNQKDGLIYRNEVFLAKQVKINGQYPDSSKFNFNTYPLFGTAFDAFREGDKIGPDRNPAAVSLLTYRTSSSTRARPSAPVETDNRIIHLNGISVEFLEQLPDGGIRLGIRWDDNTIRKNVRWCGDIHLHEELALDRGKKIQLDQGLTPTRPLNPVVINGSSIFADPSSFVVTEGAVIQMEKKSQLILNNSSSLVLQQESRINLERGARIIVSDSSSLAIHSEAVVTGKGKIILSEGARVDLDKKFVDVRIKSSRK